MFSLVACFKTLYLVTLLTLEAALYSFLLHVLWQLTCLSVSLFGGCEGELMSLRAHGAAHLLAP